MTKQEKLRIIEDMINNGDIHCDLKDAPKIVDAFFPEVEELKPCPFCGGKAVLEDVTVRKGFEAYVACNGGCLAVQRTITYDTLEEAKEKAIEAWNRRA